MAQNKIFVIFDSKAAAYLPPFFMPNAAMAMRSVGDMVNDPTSMFGKHPKDYSLFCAGSFDDRSGSFSLEPSLLVVCNLWELKELGEGQREFILAREDGGNAPRATKENGQLVTR